MRGTVKRGVAGAAAAVVVLVAAAIVIAVTTHHRSAPMMSVTEAGVRISVPAGWPKDAIDCGVPVRDTYIVDTGSTPPCALRPAPRVDYARIKPSADVRADPDAAVATAAADIAGHPGRRGADRLADGRHRWVVVVPDREVVVIAVAADESLARQIADSVTLP